MSRSAPAEQRVRWRAARHRRLSLLAQAATRIEYHASCTAHMWVWPRRTSSSCLSQRCIALTGCRCTYVSVPASEAAGSAPLLSSSLPRRSSRSSTLSAAHARGGIRGRRSQLCCIDLHARRVRVIWWLCEPEQREPKRVVVVLRPCARLCSAVVDLTCTRHDDRRP